MSKKRDHVAQSVYSRFNNNPAGNRLSTMERVYVRLLTELSINRFKWIGLPDTVDERFLELTLFHRAVALFFFHDDTSRYLATRCVIGGRVNMYDNPTAFSVNEPGVHKTFSSKRAVPIWGNALRTPDLDIVYLYAAKLAQIDRTIEINLDAMRHNYVVTCDESERQTFVNIMRQHSEGQPVILGTNNLDMTKIQAFDVGVDKDTVLNLQISKSRIWNECMTILGISNANQDKKERLVSAEVGANDEQVDVSRHSAWQARDHAAKQINQMFGLSVSVAWNPDASELANGFGTSGMTLF